MGYFDNPQFQQQGPGNIFDDPQFHQQADPKIGQPEELTFAEKYLAPALEKLGIGDVAGGNVRGSAVGRLAMGAADPGVAIAQLAANATGQGGAANSWIAQKEAEYQAARKAAGSEGFDPLRAAGATGMSLMVPGAAAVGSGVVRGAVTGGVIGALDPVKDGGDHYWKDKVKQAGIGAAGGAIMSPFLGAISRVVSPRASTNADLALLREEGVSPTVGQTLGGWANTLEEKAQSLPIVGDAISAARRRAAGQLESAGLNRGAEPIGATITQRGNAGIGDLSDKLSDAYEAVLPKMSVNVLDAPFVDKMSNLRGLVQNLPESERKQFDAVISREIDDRISPNGTLAGQNLKDAWNALRDEAKTFSKSDDAYQSKLGDAFKQAFQELKDHVSASNNAADVLALKNADFGYANFKRMQRAASYVGAEGGSPSPAQMYSATRAMDQSKDKARFAEGDALMQDLTGAGKRVLGDKYPDSGSIGRLFLGGAALGGGALAHPLAPLALGAGAAAYTPQVQNVLRYLLTRRPDMAPAVANSLRQLVAPATVAATPWLEQGAH